MTSFAAPGALTPILTKGWGEERSWTLESYLKRGGYEGLKRANTMDAADIVAEVKDSGLRGRGGAGFPTGLKWSFLPPDDGLPRYLVVNADESEPGTCKDKITAHAGAGAYICGEESALLDSLEGRRGHPRIKPPFPAVAGLYARPTVVNNVESICQVSGIFRNSAQWYTSMGTEKSKGHGLFSISGHVKNPGQFEAPFGITMRELIDMAGGIREGHTLKFWTPTSTNPAASARRVVKAPTGSSRSCCASKKARGYLETLTCWTKSPTTSLGAASAPSATQQQRPLSLVFSASAKSSRRV